MKKGIKILIVVFVLILSISVYFNITLAAAGDTAAPGSDQDPLVTKGYADQLIGTQEKALGLLQIRINTMATEKAAMNEKLNAQDLLIKALQTDTETMKTNENTLKADIKLLQDEVKALKAKAGVATPVVKDPSTTTSAQGKGVVNVATLNMRASASTTAAIIGKLTKGSSVTIVAKSGDWYKIKNAGGVTGWVLGSLITIQK